MPESEELAQLKNNQKTGKKAQKTAIFDDFSNLTPKLLPNDFTSFGGIFYLDFARLIARFLNDGLKVIKNHFCPSFNVNLGVTPKFSVSPKVVKLLGNKIGVKAPILFHNSIWYYF